MVVLEMLLLLSSAVCADVDLSRFSTKFQQLTDGQLGITQFQEMIESRLGLVQRLPDGQALAEQISRDIGERVNVFMDAVRRIQTAYNGGQIRNEIRLSLCCNLPGNLVYDQRFKQEVDVETVCHLTQPGMSIDADVRAVMKDNLERIPNIRWQFYGTEDRHHCTYPSRNQCSQTLVYDSRIRPWYTTTLNTPRDIVILMDRSTSMNDQYSLAFSTGTKFSVAKKAAAALVQYLNANDRVALLTFSDKVYNTSLSSCFSTELAVGTDDNKNQLLDQINRFGVDSTGIRANFTVAFTSAEQLFTTTDSKTTSGLYTDSEKIIVLLTDVNQIEDCEQIRQLEMDLFNNTINIFTMGIGDSVRNDPQKVSCLKKLTAGPRGAQGFVSYSDDYSDLRSQLGFYYNAFIDQIDRSNVTFSPPFTDVSGLGLQTAACLPLFLSDGNVSGVTCTEFSVEDIFRDIVNFRVGQLSYGFVIDRRGRVILHRLLPQPTYWLKQPTLLELTQVEISSYTSDIEKQILSGQSGNKTVGSISYYTATGQSDLQGVTKFDTAATYYWHAIPSMNFYMGLVIIENELQSNVTWNSVFNDFLLSDELDYKSSVESCAFFKRSSLIDKSIVKLAPMAFVYPANYTERTVSQSDINQLKSFMTFKGGPSLNLTIKSGIRDVVAATSQLESIWLQNSSDDVQRQNILSRYIGTKEGVYRRFPAVRIAKDFNPTLQPWYKTASGHPNQISFTLPFLDYASGVPSISISKIVWNRRSQNSSPNNTIMGVIGMDVTVNYLYRLLVENIDDCSRSGQECFAIDMSGFLVIHKDFGTTLPTGSLHIAAREGAIASELIANSILTADTCINYVALPITKRLFWKTDVSFSSCQQLSTCIICKLNYQSNLSTSLFLIVKLPAASINPASCACQNQTDGKYRCAYGLTSSGNQCQCPCNLSVAYDNCLANLQIDPVTWKPCIPSATLLNQADVMSDKSLTSLPSCFPCAIFTGSQLCEANNCFWMNVTSTCSSTNTTAAATTATTITTTAPTSTDIIASSTTTAAATDSASSTATPRSSSSPASSVPSSNRATTLGLAIGLSLGLCFLLTVVVAGFFAWRSWSEKRSKRTKPQKSYCTPNPVYENIDDDKAQIGNSGFQNGSGTTSLTSSASGNKSLPHVTRIEVRNVDTSTVPPPSTQEISSQYLNTGANQTSQSLESAPISYSSTC